MRFLADIALFIAAFLLPWWLVIPSAAVLFFVFPRFYELLFLALLMDLLYGVPLSRFGDFEFVLSLGTAALFLVLTVFKKRMRI